MSETGTKYQAVLLEEQSLALQAPTLELDSPRRYSGRCLAGICKLWAACEKLRRQQAFEEWFTEHDIRAMQATDADEQGLDVQQNLQHRDARTIEIYLRSKRMTAIQGISAKSFLGNDE
tara:strand:- start:2514 stop:2870 length:357 start_codon:yes stop_codon:yes gene_type:complete